MAAMRLPPADRYCDVVMKGGVTSGVVYPRAIARLARDYTFKNIGGTSAGAIAATLTAAAEYRRRHARKNRRADGMAGFERLEKVPRELGTRMPGRIRGWLIGRARRLRLERMAKRLEAGAASRLLTLFQPEPATRRLFSVLIFSLNRTSSIGRTAAIFFGFLKGYWPATAASILLSLGLWLSRDLLAAILLFPLTLVGLISLWVYRDVTRNVVDNHYGLCTGMTPKGSIHEALTPWLHQLIQETAGRGPDNDPLTFRDLWMAPGYPPPWLQLSPGGIVKSIDLQVFTTNLSHGRPYIFPGDDGIGQLYYREEELAKYLPTS